MDGGALIKQFNKSCASSWNGTPDLKCRRLIARITKYLEDKSKHKATRASWQKQVTKLPVPDPPARDDPRASCQTCGIRIRARAECVFKLNVLAMDEIYLILQKIQF